ncbi:hypothetical protein D6783_02220 [Candidatus Woesearchaeota archaeon]|nr:MAG: hypothetical protein D6783_02220 [Candidatus Woesearchaeota archaeon]
MILLGLGIAFIRNFFGSLEENTASAIAVAKIGLDPNANDPLVIRQGNDFRIKSGKSKKLEVGLYNGGEGAVDVGIFIGNCVTGEDPAYKPIPRMTTLHQRVEKGQKAGYSIFVNAKNIDDPALGDIAGKDILPGEYICSLQAVKFDPVTNSYTDEVVVERQITMSVER